MRQNSNRNSLVIEDGQIMRNCIWRTLPEEMDSCMTTVVNGQKDLETPGENLFPFIASFLTINRKTIRRKLNT